MSECIFDDEWDEDLEEDLFGTLTIYPNPVNDILNISQEVDIKLY